MVSSYNASKEQMGFNLGFKGLTYPNKKKSRGVISGDCGGQGVGPSLSVHLFGNAASKNPRTCEPQCGDAPSCWKIIHS
jgi:hypothetical protein